MHERFPYKKNPVDVVVVVVIAMYIVVKRKPTFDIWTKHQQQDFLGLVYIQY